MNKKVTIVIIVILLIISGAFLGYYYLNQDNIIEENPGNNDDIDDDPIEPVIDSDYLVIDNISNWRYSSGSWSRASKEDILNKDFVVYVNNQYYGNYQLKYGTVWNLFDESDSYVEYSGKLLAYSNKFNVVVPMYEVTNITNIEEMEISSILGHNFNSNTLGINEVVNFDLDSNGILDKIVNVSNLDSESEEDYYFNLCYVVINGEIQVIINDEVDSRSIMAYPTYELNYILRYDNNYYSFILQEGYFSNVGETKNNLYEFKDYNYVKSFSD